MRTNCKQVKAAIREHILEHYTPAELACEVSSIMRNTPRLYPTVYHAVRHMAESGCFLCYNGDIAAFLSSLDINPTGKVYEPDESFALYCHLLARDAELIVRKQTA